ncbi:thiopeptide-type bacteriocin biosynthesis protein [Actinospica durhamensis]|uniref:Thiopeptide-type bacteriocin biosynthesis protein n=1 Tax=Actinospica durhamensis TaxID=1508375 RepID=A0A941IPP6_9ACTN|nr:thiopeptide-type bacteriocin biosynthesis protein [Actinospica durhamensis]MBR7836775.1 thiopeptide-type bacteriocin biosynthesis protein [Actinospica durhamensis]
MTHSPDTYGRTTDSPDTDDVGDWQSFHVFLHTGIAEADAFLTEDLAPVLDGLAAGREGSAWFFIRYGEGGPHVRVRVRGLGAATAGLPADLSRLAAARTAVDGPWPSRHAEVLAAAYVPETGRYGGTLALPIAEELFAGSSRVAVQALRQLATGGARLTLASDFANATASALGLDRLTAAQWLRRHASGWRWAAEVALLPGEVVHSKVNSVFALQHDALVRRDRALRESLEQGTVAPWLSDWVEQVRSADKRLREVRPSTADAPSETGAGTEAALSWVWGSQLHMLLNRLGITPDEERAVCRLAARTLLDAGEPPSFFPAGHRAPDRQYLERSKFQLGRNVDSAVRSLPTPSPATALTVGNGSVTLAETALPAGPLPEISLAAALTGRTSARGPLTGPLAAAQLGALLWTAHSESHRSERQLPDGTVRASSHRPYPSAGALYSARLRLLVLDVDGLNAGTYECLPHRRSLAKVGPAPSIAEIKPLSTYFSRSPNDPDWIGIDGSPVLIGLYVDLDLLRRRYGLRALRLGLLEAGHLAQTLLLTATALGLAGTTLGGFHDDLAHELFGLDDLDHPLQYLLPLGRRTVETQSTGSRATDPDLG